MGYFSFTTKKNTNSIDGSIPASPESHETIKLEVISRLKEKYNFDENEVATKQWVDIWLDVLAIKFGSLYALKGKIILDLACGSVEPELGADEFKPWFPRLVFELGAIPV